jgi:hypothetical protein
MSITISKTVEFNAKQKTLLKEVEKVAHRLVELCRKGDSSKAVKELYAENAISIERQEIPGWPKEVKGKPAILESLKKWDDANEIHGMTIGDPNCAMGHFAVRLDIDSTNKMMGNTRMTCSELCVYEVIDGKITRADFHYPIIELKQPFA